MQLDLKLQEEVFGDMEARLRDAGVQVKRAPGGGENQLGETLCALIPVTEDGENVLLELLFVKLNEEVGLIRFYTTLVMEIEQGYEELLRADEQMNFFSPVGTFGIFPQERQFFHKYTMIIDAEDDAARLITRVRRAFDMVYATLSSYMPLVLAITEQGLSYQEALERGLLSPRE